MNKIFITLICLSISLFAETMQEIEAKVKQEYEKSNLELKNIINKINENNNFILEQKSWEENKNIECDEIYEENKDGSIALTEYYLCLKKLNNKRIIEIKDKFLFLKNNEIEYSEDLLKKVLKELQLTEDDYRKELYVEKILPYNKELTVMVIPKISEQEIDEYNHYYGVFDSYIVVVNNITKEIINKYYEKDAWTSDAVVLNKINIDTAPYILNENKRAFGVRVYYQGSSRVNPYSQEDISLFILEKDSLKKVLNNYPIYELHGENNGDSKGENEIKQGKLIISDNKTNGFNNIIIKDEIVFSIYDFSNDKEEKSIIKKASKTLRFNGIEYK